MKFAKYTIFIIMYTLTEISMLDKYMQVCHICQALNISIESTFIGRSKQYVVPQCCTYFQTITK